MTCKRLDVLYSSGGFADVALGPKVENKINNNNKYYLIGLRKKIISYWLIIIQNLFKMVKIYIEWSS